MTCRQNLIGRRLLINTKPKTKMERTLKLTWSEVVKWLVLVVGIASTYAVMQTKIASLEESDTVKDLQIRALEDRMRVQEAEVAKINAKLDNIGEDVKIIKDHIINDNAARGR